MLESAIKYVEQGYSVIPLLPKDKKPAIEWKEFQNRKPTTNELTIWFKDNKKNIGIVTGAISGLTVIDLDGKNAFDWAADSERGIPDTPIVKTGKEYGYHLYCSFNDKLRNFQARDNLPNIDLRSEGGYVVAPPSIHPNGSTYQWISKPDVPPALIPPWFLKIALTNYSVLNTTTNTTTDIYNSIFGANRKDIDLFHVANAMNKGRLEPEYMQKVLEILINSWGENNPKWAADKVLSAMKRGELRNKSLADEVREWVISSSGVFFSSEVKNFLHLSSLDEEKNLSTILRRMVVDGIIEKSGKKNGCWIKVNQEEEEIKFMEATGEAIDLILPLRAHELCLTYPKNIICIAGMPNAGKTAFMLNTVYMNQNKFKIYYFSSEMGSLEMKIRLEKFNYPLDKWKFKAIEKSDDFHTVIRPNDVNIIDFLEIYKDYYEINGKLAEIYNKLEEGIAIVAIQKNPGAVYGAGGAKGLEKPKLYITLDNVNGINTAKIVKGKNWANETLNPNGLEMQFKLVNGWQFIEQGNWHYNWENTQKGGK